MPKKLHKQQRFCPNVWHFRGNWNNELKKYNNGMISMEITIVDILNGYEQI